MIAFFYFYLLNLKNIFEKKFVFKNRKKVSSFKEKKCSSDWFAMNFFLLEKAPRDLG